LPTTYCILILPSLKIMEACRRLNQAMGTDGDLLEIWREIIFNLFSFPFFFVFVLRRWHLPCLLSCYIVFYMYLITNLEVEGPCVRYFLSLHDQGWTSELIWSGAFTCPQPSKLLYMYTCTLGPRNVESHVRIDTSWDNSKHPFYCRFFRGLPCLSGAKEKCAINLRLGYMTECRCTLVQQPRR
jgi:hypothetical protein